MTHLVFPVALSMPDFQLAVGSVRLLASCSLLYTFIVSFSSRNGGFPQLSNKFERKEEECSMVQGKFLPQTIEHNCQSVNP
jgi:hypothetical protein